MSTKTKVVKPEMTVVSGGLANRMETGVMQFGNDWPGVFIRGDNAAGYAMDIEIALNSYGEDSGGLNAITENSLNNLMKLLRSASEKPA